MKKYYIVGIDEAGRWPWAGPVVAWWWMAEFTLANILLDSLDGLNDSKLLSAHRREFLYKQIDVMAQSWKCWFSKASRDPIFIDTVGIREANRQCMQDSIATLLSYIDKEDRVEIFIDGCDNYLFDLDEVDIWYDFQRQSREKKLLSKPVTWRERIKIDYRIGWDKSCKAISAASIIAKVTRDRIMCDFHAKYPVYGFDSHKGYGTRKHQDALLHYGISPIHRKSYAPIKRLISVHS